MAEAAFDTIAEVQRLRDAGFEQTQAEAITRSIHAGVTGGVATKADIERLEGKISTQGETLRKEIEAFDAKLDAQGELLETKIESSAKSTIIWLGGLMFGLAVALGVIERLLPPSG